MRTLLTCEGRVLTVGRRVSTDRGEARRSIVFR